MAKLRNKFGEPREVPGHGVVDVDAVIEVPDAWAYSYSCQEGWHPVDKAANTAHDAGQKAAAKAATSADQDAVVPEADPQPDGS